MRALLSVSLIVLLLGLTTMDRVLCQDGCTDPADAHSSAPASPSACSLCHGWSGPVFTIDVDLAAPATFADPVADGRELTAHPPRVERPPRYFLPA